MIVLEVGKAKTKPKKQTQPKLNMSRADRFSWTSPGEVKITPPPKTTKE